MTVAHLKNLHEYLEKSHPERVDDGFKAGFSKCLEAICHFVEKETSLSITQKNRLLSHITNFSLASEHGGNSVDDTASSYSGNSSRSNTPSSAVNDPTSLEYLPCSPFSDSTQEGSSSSSSPPSNTRTTLCRNLPPNTSFSSNLSIGNRSNRLPSSGALPGSSVGLIEADSASYNMNRPLNLASSSRTLDKNIGQCDNNNPRNRNTSNNDYGTGINVNRAVAEENVATGRCVFRSGLDVDDSVLMQIDPVWRPW